MQKMTVHVWSHTEIENLIRKSLKRDYEIPEAEELSNDSDRFFPNVGLADTEIYEQITAWADGKLKFVYLTDMLRYLVSMGYIPEGNHLIRVSW